MGWMAFNLHKLGPYMRGMGGIMLRTRGGHSTVKLETMCEQKKSIFSKLHQQNGSKFYQKFYEYIYKVSIT